MKQPYVGMAVHIAFHFSYRGIIKPYVGIQHKMISQFLFIKHTAQRNIMSRAVASV